MNTDHASQVTAELVPRIPETVASAEVDGETVIYDEVRERVHVLSPTATLVWNGIDGRTSLGHIAEGLSRSFGEHPAVVRSDVIDLARDLLERGLIAGPDHDRPPSESANAPVDRERPGTPRFLLEPPSG